MIESGECTVAFTPQYNLPKQPISGGHHSSPVKNHFFVIRAIVERKNVFVNSIFCGKKNRFVACPESEKDEPIIKGLDGLADSNPLWVRRWFKDILIEIIKHPNTRFEVVPRMLKEAFNELNEICNDKSQVENELKFTQRLKKQGYEYSEHVRTGAIAG
jgi:hypothetical protein